MHLKEPKRTPWLCAALGSVAALALGLGAMTLAVPAANAEPPSWAPANGYRAQEHRQDDEGDRGDDHERDHRREYEHDDEHHREHERDDRRERDHRYNREREGDRDHRREREHDYERERRRSYPRQVQRAPRGWGPYINSRGVCTWTQLDTALGGALGGVLGSQIGAGSGNAIATVGGVVLGALVGHALGEHMDATDQYCAGTALRYAPPGRPVVWVDPHTHWRYRFVPEQRFRDHRGEECRHFTQYARRNGRTRRHRGIACRAPHGSWHMQR